ncbi:hypothetical protein GCM10010503_63110 [Streptomyces lucensis JCM 4490]|uniref:Uncharacterized protein n=1 Tax=Streptomyces lucensis JCM 4490 TaxID=1306176 RepID=A0A918JEC3_9ACTN|nr:hypothetical protein GCM10010503_63110 [Streptomyces lucensis JCM 4490]
MGDGVVSLHPLIASYGNEAAVKLKGRADGNTTRIQPLPGFGQRSFETIPVHR